MNSIACKATHNIVNFEWPAWHACGFHQIGWVASRTTDSHLNVLDRSGRKNLSPSGRGMTAFAGIIRLGAAPGGHPTVGQTRFEPCSNVGQVPVSKIDRCPNSLRRYKLFGDVIRHCTAHHEHRAAGDNALGRFPSVRKPQAESGLLPGIRVVCDVARCVRTSWVRPHVLALGRLHLHQFRDPIKTVAHFSTERLAGSIR